MQIFDDRPRSDSSPAAHNETYFDFLNRVDSPFWARVRALIEDWFQRLPNPAQSDVCGQIHSGDNRHFKAAFWELYLHESLLRLGYEVEVHPSLNDTASRPDFLATGDAGPIVIEAAYIGSSDEDAAAERRRDDLYEALDQLNSPNFFLWIDLDEEGSTSPSVVNLRPRLEDWLSGLDPDQVARVYERGEFNDLPTFSWQDRGWEVTFRAIPKSPEARGESGVRPLGVFGHGGASFIDDQTPLRRKLDKKSRKYGNLDMPYVIAIWHGAFSADDWSIDNVMIGSEVAQVPRDPSQAARLARKPNGFWGGPSAARRENVSAVLVITRLGPASVVSSEPCLWLNPRARHPVEPDALPWRTVSFDPETGHKTDEPASLSPGELFQLPEDWPGPEPLFPE